MYLALQYEKQYTKNQILARYLNGVFYGQNAVGVQAASLTYFDKDVREITLPQAALLAGLPQAPTAYNPFENPDEARGRRNVVLEEMAEQGLITREDAERAKRAGLDLKRGQAYKRKREEYFFEYVRQVLIDRYGENEVQNGGFKVYTTIDPALQSAARRTIRENLYYDDDPDAAVVMIDSQKGFIRAMASSQRFSEENQFNLATQARRQPGSTFKTFVLTEAIRQRINPYSTLYASKKLDFVDKDYGPIDVATYSNSYRGAHPDRRRPPSARTTPSSSSSPWTWVPTRSSRPRTTWACRRSASCPTSPRSASGPGWSRRSTWRRRTRRSRTAASGWRRWRSARS